MTENRIKEFNLLIFHAVDRNGDGIEKTLATLREAGITHLLGVGGDRDREEPVESLRDGQVCLDIQCDGYWGWRLEDGSVIEVDEELSR